MQKRHEKANRTERQELLDEMAVVTELHPLLSQLERISISTVRRRLKRIHQDQPRLPRKGPGRAN